ncbi:unnamed protein product [[Candida] boidinii]|nr:unnamed protein product [[Candida] boidinii]
MRPLSLKTDVIKKRNSKRQSQIFNYQNKSGIFSSNNSNPNSRKNSLQKTSFFIQQQQNHQQNQQQNQSNLMSGSPMHQTPQSSQFQFVPQHNGMFIQNFHPYGPPTPGSAPGGSPMTVVPHPMGIPMGHPFQQPKPPGGTPGAVGNGSFQQHQGDISASPMSGDYMMNSNYPMQMQPQVSQSMPMINGNDSSNQATKYTWLSF